jgi:integrase
MATIEKRTTSQNQTSYRAKVRVKGFPQQSATFPKYADANRWAQLTEAAIREGKHFKHAEAKRHTLAELIDRYQKSVLPHKPKLLADQTRQLNWFKAEAGNYALADITPALLTQYRDKLLEDREPATVNRYFSALSSAFTTAVNEWQWLESSPVSKVKKPKEPRGRVRYLTDEERERLLEACKESASRPLYLCVVLALATGMRRSELMNLGWRDVNVKDGYLILHETKNGDRRRVYLKGAVLNLLRGHAKVRRLDTDLLFPSPNNKDEPINLRKAFDTALREAEIDDFRWHDLRHCTASYLAMNGATLMEIAEVLGHKTLQMVKRYAHLSEGHVSEVVAAMNERIFGGLE